MQRRALLRYIASASAAFPLHRVRVWAQVRELPPQAVAALHQIGAAVLPASIGEPRIRSVVDAFVAWTRGYREDVPLAHGYGHPRLEKTGPTPVPKYLTQLDALDRAARARGGPFETLDRESQRVLLDRSLVTSGIRAMPPRPSGQHVVADLMAFYFRSSEANDDCYRALIQREVCRPIEVTVRRPQPK